MTPVIFHAAAEAELEAASDYYESCRKGLGAEFEAAVEAAIKRLSQAPAVCPPHGATGFRKALVRRFPYTLYFLERANDFWIAAVAHQRRQLGYWSRRKPNS